MRTGILGGTFDPIHFAHLYIAEQARVQYALDRVLFIPNSVPPHKKKMKISPSEIRCQMIEIALRDNPAFSLSRIEVDRCGVSYTADTLLQLRHQSPEDSFFFITGTDAMAFFPSWHRPETILELCTCLVAERKGFGYAKLMAQFPESYKKKIYPLKGQRLAISATCIRQHIQKSLPIRYLTPDGVAQFISENNVYQNYVVK
jgi:nicotinate-nucleotide adenylyltransferase